MARAGLIRNAISLRADGLDSRRRGVLSRPARMPSAPGVAHDEEPRLANRSISPDAKMDVFACSRMPARPLASRCGRRSSPGCRCAELARQRWTSRWRSASRRCAPSSPPHGEPSQAGLHQARPRPRPWARRSAARGRSRRETAARRCSDSRLGLRRFPSGWQHEATARRRRAPRMRRAKIGCTEIARSIQAQQTCRSVRRWVETFIGSPGSASLRIE